MHFLLFKVHYLAMVYKVFSLEDYTQFINIGSIFPCGSKLAQFYTRQKARVANLLKYKTWSFIYGSIHKIEETDDVSHHYTTMHNDHKPSEISLPSTYRKQDILPAAVFLTAKNHVTDRD